MRCTAVYTGSNERGDKGGKLVNRKRFLITVAITVAAVLLTSSSCTTSANRRPTIASLEAEAEWTAPSGSIQVTCSASDPDGDTLSYEWITTGGDISGTGVVTVWTAPEEVGMYDITIVVDDGHDGKDTKSLTLITSNGPPPSIQNLIVTAKEPKYLKTTSTGYKVGKTKEYYIQCIASATNGELTYEWSSNGGAISGDGSAITWTAPDTSTDVAVTVRVVDSAGNWVEKSVVLEVVSCSSCAFG